MSMFGQASLGDSSLQSGTSLLVLSNALDSTASVINGSNIEISESVSTLSLDFFYTSVHTSCIYIYSV